MASIKVIIRTLMVVVIALFCGLTFNYYIKDEHKERRTLGGATINNQGTAGLRQSTDFPDHIKRVLDLYRVVI